MFWYNEDGETDIMPKATKRILNLYSSFLRRLLKAFMVVTVDYLPDPPIENTV